MIKIGQRYKHYKGNLYDVITVAKHTETEELMVVYVDISDQSKIWARPYEMFVGTLEDGSKRFQLIKD